METSLTENEMHDNLNSSWENSPDENEDKIFNQVIDEEIETIRWKINRIPKTEYMKIDHSYGLSHYEIKTDGYRKELEDNIKFLEDWKTKVNKRGSK